jgi:hypothetical protein
MVDSLLALAMSMHSGKGIYALLLGSGVSKSAGLPTGWDIVLDLIRKLAALKGETAEPDPEAWYKSLTGVPPDYSDILDEVTKSSSERALLLRSYFEPTEDERQNGQKLPTPAHRAIAALVSKGYIRVIVTTNFDRLMEQALADTGVQATVISTPDAIVGAMPITHSACTIIKLHGDYFDSRLKNTRDELSAYDKPLNDLLDRVFDEFGLIVCGWSGEWDVALRSAVERISTHRFGTYWTARGKPGPVAEKLIALRRASTIVISDSDSFFNELAEKIQAIEEFSLADPVSARVAVARLKRYLATPDQQISLHDLLVSETERVYKAVRGDRYSVTGYDVSGQGVKDRLKAYESDVSVLLSLMICGGYWAGSNQLQFFLQCIKRLADQRSESGINALLALRPYPALLLFYGAGIAGLAGGNYAFLGEMFKLNIRTPWDRDEVPITKALNTERVMSFGVQRMLPGREKQITPLSEHLFAGLRELLRESIPDDAFYDETFDWFEYLMALIHCDLTISREDLAALKAKQNWEIRGPHGRFVWKGAFADTPTVQQKAELRAGHPYPVHVGSLRKSGFFGSDERYLDLKRGFDASVAKMAGRW